MGRRAKIQGDERTAVAYVRVSTDDQLLGPAAQRTAIERWAQANGVMVAAVFEDLGLSGGAAIDKRPGLLAALNALPLHRAGLLLVAKRDRLARDVLVCGMIEQVAQRSGARIVSSDGNGNGDGPEASLLRGISDVFSQYERALIRARTKAALAVKKSKGERIGTVPFGSCVSADGVMLEPNPSEQATLSEIRSMRERGYTFQGIADALNAAGRPARGKRWHLRSVFVLCKRQADAGEPTRATGRAAA